jgi:hypothetical protein
MMVFEAGMALIFILTGTCILIWTAWNIISALLSRGWPETAGTILVSDLQRSKDKEGEFSYSPEVTYCYSVDGKELISSRVEFGDRIQTSRSAPALRTVRRYPVGSSVTVRYNPHDPREAVLQPRVNGWLLAAAAFGAAFTGMGILALRSAL